MGRKNVYDITAIFSIKVLMQMKLIETYKEGAKVYHELTGQEISPSVLSSRIKNFTFTSSVKVKGSSTEENPEGIIETLLTINPTDAWNYLKRCDSALRRALPERFNKEEEQESESYVNKGPKEQIIRTFNITKEALVNDFGVDLEKDDDLTIVRKVRSKMADEPFFLEYLGYDPADYEIATHDWGSWEVTVNRKLKDGSSVIDKITNYKFHIVIRKRKKPVFYVSQEQIKKILDEHLDKKSLTPYDLFDDNITNIPVSVFTGVTPRNKERLIVSPGLELHLGKLGSVSDFEDYSIKQAMARFRQIAKEIVKYQNTQEASKILMAVGNDLFNSDTADDKTTAGTPQDNDTRFKEIYLWGQVGFIRMVETVKEFFDQVILKGNPGNHDETFSFALFTALYNIYDMVKDDKVKVDLTYEDMRFRTYEMFGDNLIIFDHGKHPRGKPKKESDLAKSVRDIFPYEAQHAARIYLIVGHKHRDFLNTYDGITILRQASPSGVDAYHAANGYIAPRQGHSFYTFDAKLGLYNHQFITLSAEDKLEKIPSINRDPKVNVVQEMARVFNFSPKVVKKELKADELKKLKATIQAINNNRDMTIEGILQCAGVNTGSLTKDQLQQMRGLFVGHEAQINALNHQSELKMKIK